MTYVENPVRRGFYPDPSVCRANGRYYCVHSTFGYAPGIPVFESRDLVRWEQIGHALLREEQLRLDGAPVSGGIYAPTIRWHKGLFYIVVTNVTWDRNFYITAKDPAGPWSKPCALEGAEGIDPSLYFEGDHCYYIGQRQKKNGAYFGDCEIWLQELDLNEGKLAGAEYILWDGAMKRTWWPEGPHIYRKDGYYYLLIAEGGTEYHHSISVARSQALWGPYESCPSNPIFTHRHLGRKYPVQSVGHGDLIEGPDGRWYIYMLGTRTQEGCAELGRETFVAEVSWEEGWPVINPGEGRLRRWQKICGASAAKESTDGPVREMLTEEIRTEKEQTVGRSAGSTLPEGASGAGRQPAEYEIAWTFPLDLRLVTLRKFLPDWPEGSWRIQDGCLRLKCGREPLHGNGVPAYVGIRMEEREFALETELDVRGLNAGEEAGLVLFYDEKNYVKLSVSPQNKEDGTFCGGVEIRREGESRIAAGPLPLPVENEETLVLWLKGENQRLAAGILGAWARLLSDLDIRFLSSEYAGGFTGCTMGIYAQTAAPAEQTKPSAAGKEEQAAADFSCGEAIFGPLRVTWHRPEA